MLWPHPNPPGAGSAGTEVFRGVTVNQPNVGEDITIFYTPVALTLSSMRAVVRGSTPSVTWTVRHATTRDAAGAEVVTGGTTTTDASSGSDVTTMDDPTIPAGSFVWLETTAVSGTVDEFALSLYGTLD